MRRDRPAQFAAIRTDFELNEVGAPIMLYCQPANDFLPEPEACLITGITPQVCMEKGLPEHQFAAQIEKAFSQSGTIGVVAGYPVPEVNRIVNAFIQGAKEANPKAEVLVTFLNSWFDPAAAKEAALAQVDAGADVLFAERFGVIEAAQEKKLLVCLEMF